MAGAHVSDAGGASDATRPRGMLFGALIDLHGQIRHLHQIQDLQEAAEARAVRAETQQRFCCDH